MKKKFLATYLTGLMILASMGIASASSIDVGFNRVTANVPLNIGSQLHLSILDEGSAGAQYSIDIDANQVLFIFTNVIGVSSNISEIYIDDGDLAFDRDQIINSISGTTNFTSGANPSNLPGANLLSPDFEANPDLSIDAQGGSSLGINAPEDILGIVFDVSPSVSILNNIKAALISGDLRIGLHVRAIDNVTSDAYVNTSPVPEPATMFLFGTSLVGLVGAVRKRGKK
ncbi:MAG: PEP-CTERM sorting domain-containing protein [Desulfoprunum sp.]|nr:PEP-CTERM sorting domain-containing protein [Desulfoprunum sp.]